MNVHKNTYGRKYMRNNDWKRKQVQLSRVEKENSDFGFFLKRGGFVFLNFFHRTLFKLASFIP